MTRTALVAKFRCFQLKMMTRTALVVKFGHFPVQNSDENGPRR
ncbi:hypothetical protein [Caldifermentibacillus hisashii]